MNLEKMIEFCLKDFGGSHLTHDIHKNQWQIMNHQKFGQEGLYDKDLIVLFKKAVKEIKRQMAEK